MTFFLQIGTTFCRGFWPTNPSVRGRARGNMHLVFTSRAKLTRHGEDMAECPSLGPMGMARTSVRCRLWGYRGAPVARAPDTTTIHGSAKVVQRTMTEPNTSQNQTAAIELELARLGEELLALQQELAKKNAEYERIASYDGLTGLLNRRAILERVNEWLLHVKRYKGHLTVVMLDIDHFKEVNDKHGHRVGDRVLTDLAAMMQRSIRKTDFVGRYGGEEFLIVLPRTDAAGAAIMAERVRSSLATVPIHDTEGNAFMVTASLGIAECLEGDNEDSLISRADAALYRAKEAGRNRVEIAARPD